MWISKDKYIDRMRDGSWLPGWEAIRNAFAAVYGDSGRYVSAAELPDMHSGLDGFGVYKSPHGYTHIVTRGLSQIRPHRDACNNQHSGWGLELTIKWPDADAELSRAFHMLDKMAECVDVRKDGWMLLFPQERLLERVPEELLSEPGGALAIVPDTEIPAIDTIHGEVQFRQIVSVSAHDHEILRQYPTLIMQVLFNMSKQDVDLPFRRSSQDSLEVMDELKTI